MRNLIAFLKRFQIFLVFALLQVIALSIYFSFFVFPRSQYLTTASNVAGKMYAVRNDVMKQFNLSRTNKVLQESNAELMEQLPESFMKIDRELVSINDTVFKQQYSYIPATVVNSTVEKRNNYFTIDAGSIQGIKRGMGVFSDDGVVGVIHNVSEHYSVVKSVLTENINIDVIIQPIGLYGLLKWDGNDPRRGSVAGISNDLTIKKWSRVETRGGAGIFPKGIPVGKVETLKSVEGEAFWDVSIVYAVDFRKLQHVYVIKNQLLEEQQALESRIPVDPVE